jgi:hypothetical protein
MALFLTFGALGWMLPHATLYQPGSRATRYQAGGTRVVPVMDGKANANHYESEGTICEFEEGKSKRPMLGVIQSHIKKGSNVVYQVVDADDRAHTVPSKSLHCVFAANRMTKPGTPNAEILSEYLEASRCKATELGVDVDMLELAWEMCSEEGAPSYSREAIISFIDDALVEGSVQKYKAFRLMSSSLGNIFFNTLHAHDYAHTEYKVKSAVSVTASKESWCAEGSGEAEEWCFA